MIWKGIVKWKKTIRFALTGSHSVSGAVNFAAGAVFYFTLLRINRVHEGERFQCLIALVCFLKPDARAIGLAEWPFSAFYRVKHRAYASQECTL